MKIKELLKKYDHAIVFLYALIYMPWFGYLEQNVTRHYYLIHSPIDDYIPFVEYFIIPYLLWFAFMAIGGLYVFFKDKEVFLKMAAFLIIGMTVFLLICTFFPNGQHLRPTTFARDNIFVDMVKHIYATDTPTNILPSMHVFNSIGLCLGLVRVSSIKNRPALRIAIHLFTLSIILSTMFLKQHSATDVVAAIAMSAVLYRIIYVHEEKKVHRLTHQPVH